MAVQTFATCSVRPAERLAYWNGVVADCFHGLSVQAPDRRDFRADLSRWSLGRVGLMRARASRSTVARIEPMQPDAEQGERVTLQLQRGGFSHLRQGSRSAALAPGDLTLCDASRPFTIEVSDRNDVLILDLPARLIAGSGRLLDLRAQRLCGSSAGVRILHDFVRSLWREYGSPGAPPPAGEALERVLLDLVGNAVRDHAGARPPAPDSERLLAWISARCGDPNLHTSTIAGGTGLSVRTIQEIFARLATTPTAYLNHCRLNRARSLLRRPEGGRSITDIALECGFSDPGYFARLFRREFSVSPKEFAGRRNRYTDGPKC